MPRRPPPIIDEGPGEHDRHLIDDDPEQTVPCGHCGRPIWPYANRCPHCGIHFAGEAWQFKPRSTPADSASHRLKVIFVILLIIAFLAVFAGIRFF